jgi:TRAP-type transport system small permease protein
VNERAGNAARGSWLPPAPAAPLPIAALGALVDWTVVTIGAVMTVLVFANVVLHLLSRDLAWVIELSELLMVWVTFLGAAAATRRGAHMAVTELVDLVHGASRRVVEAAIQLCVAGVLLLLTVYGWRLMIAGWHGLLTVLDWPMGIQYMALPVGSAVALVFVCWDLVQVLRGRTRAERFDDATG